MSDGMGSLFGQGGLSWAPPPGGAGEGDAADFLATSEQAPLQAVLPPP